MRDAIVTTYSKQRAPVCASSPVESELKRVLLVDHRNNPVVKIIP